MTPHEIFTQALLDTLGLLVAATLGGLLGVSLALLWARRAGLIVIAVSVEEAEPKVGGTE